MYFQILVTWCVHIVCVVHVNTRMRCACTCIHQHAYVHVHAHVYSSIRTRMYMYTTACVCACTCQCYFVLVIVTYCVKKSAYIKDMKYLLWSTTRAAGSITACWRRWRHLRILATIEWEVLYISRYHAWLITIILPGQHKAKSVHKTEICPKSLW